MALLIDRTVIQQFVQVVDGRHISIVKTDDQIAGLQFRIVGRSVRFDVLDQNAGAHIQSVVGDKPSVELDGLPGNADVTAPDLAVEDQFADDELDQIGSDRET